MRRLNIDLLTKLLILADYGDEDMRNAANARLAALRDTFRHDRRFPSTRPVFLAVEVDAWTWIHEMKAKYGSYSYQSTPA
jgi:hypothetical protein